MSIENGNSREITPQNVDPHEIDTEFVRKTERSTDMIKWLRNNREEQNRVRESMNLPSLEQTEASALNNDLTTFLNQGISHEEFVRLHPGIDPHEMSTRNNDLTTFLNQGMSREEFKAKHPDIDPHEMSTRNGDISTFLNQGMSREEFNKKHPGIDPHNPLSKIKK